MSRPAGPSDTSHSVDSPDVIDVGATARRLRMGLALDILPLGQFPGASRLTDWLDAQPMPLVADDAADELVVSTSVDLRRLTWWAAGPTERFIPAVVDFMKRVGASREEAEKIAGAGAHLAPDRVGSWIELSAGGIDGGWYFPAALPLAAARTYAAPSLANERLGAWADEVGASQCLQLRRAIGMPQPMTELLIPLSGLDTAAQLAQARHAFDGLHVPWIGDNIADAASGADAMTVRVALTDDGVSRIGLELPDPDMGVVLGLAGISPHASDSYLAMFMGTLGVRGPEWLGVSRQAGGLDVELYFAP